MAAVRAVAAEEDEEDWKKQQNSSKAPRLPRWTRQEILVLIQGKKVAESRVRRGRTSGVEPKWATVSSYCKRHGVNRGAVQCRKRWSNLAGDFKKIKDWESAVSDDSESFWLMRNDLRRERKLPGFFDREVFDILDANHHPHSAADTTIEEPLDHDVDDDDDHDTADDAVQPPTTTTGSSPILFDSSRSAAADHALFSEFEHPNTIPLAIPAPIPISAKQYEPAIPAPYATPPPPPPPPPSPGTKQKQAAAAATSNPEIGSTSRKRRRVVVEDEAQGLEFEDELVQVLDKNAQILSAQLQAHNLNLKLDREQRKDNATSVVAVLNKLADALARIADKL